VRACTFVADATVGTQRFKPGDTASLPEAFVRALVRRGLATDQPPVPVVAPPESPDQASDSQEERAKPGLSKRALRKLLRRKA
jgi:hypothetical protein